MFDGASTSFALISSGPLAYTLTNLTSQATTFPQTMPNDNFAFLKGVYNIRVYSSSFDSSLMSRIATGSQQLPVLNYSYPNTQVKCSMISLQEPSMPTALYEFTLNTGL